MDYHLSQVSDFFFERQQVVMNEITSIHKGIEEVIAVVKMSGKDIREKLGSFEQESLEAIGVIKDVAECMRKCVPYIVRPKKVRKEILQSFIIT
jgi:hypothetical protein